MPPRHAYWTILVDEQPTAFRAAMQEDLQPTFKRLKEKHASTRLVWFQNGKIWNSRLDAQEAMYARGEMGRRGDARQGGGFRDRHDRDRLERQEPREERDGSGKLAWKPRGSGTSSGSRPQASSPRPQAPGPKPQARRPADEGRAQKLRPDWKPKQQGLAPRDHLLRRSVVKDAKAAWKLKGEKPAWKPEGNRKPEWRPKGTYTPRPKAESAAARSAKAEKPPLEWKPKGAATGAPKRKWVPKEEYKKQQGIEAKRDQKWRPGGEHRDPRQKYKDAKKAKWTRFKQNIRKNWERKQDGAPKKKRRDEE
jgi:hypothetical protein